DHPDVLAIRKRIELTRQYLTHPLRFRGAAAVAEGEDKLGAKDPVGSYVRALKQELQGLRGAEQSLERVLEREYHEAAKPSKYEDQLDSFRKEEARADKLYEAIIKRLQDASLSKDLGGYEAEAVF